jgi:hypothetical protein
MKQDKVYRNWEEFEREQRRRCATFQLSLDELAKDLYLDYEADEEEDEVKELDFDM